MQFFPHIESGNSSLSSSSAGFFADKPTDSGFASLLSSHLDEHGMSGDGALADNSVSHAQTSDSSAPAASLPKSSSSESELETSHKSISSTGESVPEDSLEHEVLTLGKEAARLEILAGDQQKLSANPAAPEARRKDVEHSPDSADVGKKRGENSLVQDMTGLLRTLESLLDSIRQDQADAGDKFQTHGESVSGALGQLLKLVDAARKKVVAAGEDAGNSVRSGLEQITTHDLGALQEGLRDILQTVKNTFGRTLREGKGRNAGHQVPAEALRPGSGKDVSLSAQDQEVLREALARLENIKARFFGKEQPEQKHGPVRPAHKPETPAKIKPENKTAQHQTPGATEIAAPGVQSKTQSASVQASAVIAEKSMDQGVRSVSKLTSESKTEQSLPSGVGEIAQSVQSRPAPGRDAATDKSVEQGEGFSAGKVVSEQSAVKAQKGVTEVSSLKSQDGGLVPAMEFSTAKSVEQEVRAAAHVKPEYKAEQSQTSETKHSTVTPAIQNGSHGSPVQLKGGSAAKNLAHGEDLSALKVVSKPSAVGAQKKVPGSFSQPKFQADPASAMKFPAGKEAGQEESSVAKVRPDHKLEPHRRSGPEEVAAQTIQSRRQGTSTPAREVPEGKEAEQGVRPVVGAMASEPTADASEKQGGGKFFRDSASKGGDRIEEKILDRSEKLEPVSSRGTPDSGRIQHMKMPEADGVFTVQPNAVSSFNTSGPDAKSRSAEVYRQVETGAFRDLGQGNKQLVIRLDPPDLGQVSVVLQVRGKEVQAVLRTNNQEASQALADQLGQLRSQLESQGLRVSRLEVQTQLADSQIDSQWQGAEQHNRYQENRELAMTAQRLRSLGRVESTLAQDVQTSHHKENISLTGVDVFA